jgi:hypothetical protein
MDGFLRPVSVPALLHEIALVNDFAITLAFRANSGKKDELSRICNGDDFRELTLRPFVIIEIFFLEGRCWQADSRPGERRCGRNELREASLENEAIRDARGGSV